MLAITGKMPVSESNQVAVTVLTISGAIEKYSAALKSESRNEQDLCFGYFAGCRVWVSDGGSKCGEWRSLRDLCRKSCGGCHRFPGKEKTAEGALIGAVAGATTGTIAGNAIDREIAQQKIADQRQIQQQVATAVSMDQVIRMAQSGLGSDVITQQIHAQGIIRRPTIDDLITLKQNGVDDRVINALQQARIAGQSAPVRVVERLQPVPIEPVIVEPCPPVPPFRYRPPRRYYRVPRVRPVKPGVSFSFDF